MVAHYVEKADFLADLREQGITDDLEAAYAKHLDDVDAVQNEQQELLRALVEQYGVTAVYVEGVTKRDMPVYTARLKTVKSLAKRLELLRKAAADIDDLPVSFLETFLGFFLFVGFRCVFFSVDFCLGGW